jgi:hypothetical protein
MFEKAVDNHCLEKKISFKLQHKKEWKHWKLNHMITMINEE